MAIIMNEAWNKPTVCSQFSQLVHNFLGFEKVDEESKEVFGDLVTLSEKVELDLQKDDLTELMAVQREELTNDDLMELEAQRKGEERQEKEVTEEPKRAMVQEAARAFSFFEEVVLVFEAQVPFWIQNGTQRLQEPSECSPVLPCHLW